MRALFRKYQAYCRRTNGRFFLRTTNRFLSLLSAVAIVSLTRAEYMFYAFFSTSLLLDIFSFKIFKLRESSYKDVEENNLVAGVVLYNEGFLILTGTWDLGTDITSDYKDTTPVTESYPRWTYFGSRMTSGSLDEQSDRDHDLSMESKEVAFLVLHPNYGSSPRLVSTLV